MQTQELFYLHQNEEQFGPYPIKDLSTFAEEGRFDENSLIYIEDTAEWVPVLTFLNNEDQQQETIQNEPVQVEAKNTTPLTTPIFAISHTDKSNSAKVESEPKKETFELSRLQFQEQKTLAVTVQQTSHNVWNVRPQRQGQLIVKIKKNNGTSEKAILVQPGSVRSAKIKTSEQAAEAGTSINLQVIFCDEFGNAVSDFNSTATVQAIGQNISTPESISVFNGVAETIVTSPIAQDFQIQISCQAADKIITAQLDLTIHAAAPSDWTVIAPETIKAGEIAKVYLSAIDAFGNAVIGRLGYPNTEIVEQFLAQEIQIDAELEEVQMDIGIATDNEREKYTI